MSKYNIDISLAIFDGYPTLIDDDDEILRMKSDGEEVEDIRINIPNETVHKIIEDYKKGLSIS